MSVEPRFFVPVVPALLLNGTKGIGTGWSTYVPPYNALQVANHVRMRVRGLTPTQPLKPWIKGFVGDIEAAGESYTTNGTVKKTSTTTIEVSELPYGVWTDKYKELLTLMCQKGTIKALTEHHTTGSVLFKIKMAEVLRLLSLLFLL